MKATGTSLFACSSTVFIVAVILIITNAIRSLNADSVSCGSCGEIGPGDVGSTWTTWAHWACILMDSSEPWQNWSGCSRTCGGGTRTRNRYRCCDLGKVQKCTENGNCSELCLNSGTFDTQCRCTDEVFGTCCEEGKRCFVRYIC